MLTLFTIKKILFFGTLGSGIFGPIIATSPLIREFAWSSDVSPLKEGLYNLNLVDIYEGESIPTFFKKTLLFQEGWDGLIESIAQELARRWYFDQPSHWIWKQREAWKKLQAEQFKEAWEKLKPVNAQRDFWDNYWGSRENMNSFWLRHNSYKLVKEFLTAFNKSEFTLNKEFEKKDEGYKSASDLKNVFAKSYSASNTELEKSDNWSKIGFFPSSSKAESQSNEWKQFVWGKYEFINWCYKHWFNKHLPAYFWKISWFYNKDATSSDLAKEYNKEFLKSDFPEKTHYGFPVFSQSTTKKFQGFIKKIAESSGSNNGRGDSTGGDSQGLNLEKYYIEGYHGDQAHPATLLEVLNSFETVSPEYASASTYLINKVLEGSNGTPPTGTGASSNSTKINELKLDKYKNGQGKNNGDTKPISIFFNDNGADAGAGTQSQDNKHLVTFDSQILANGSSNNGSKKHVYDVRETDTGNWIFFRDDQGVHALTLDGHLYLNQNSKSNNDSTTKDAKEKLWHWFNFRNLQSKSSRFLFTKKSLQVAEDWFAKFKDYFTKYFDRLLVEYYLQKGDKSLLFNSLASKDREYFNLFKELLTNLFELIDKNELNSKLFNLRKKIIEKYSVREWSLNGSDKEDEKKTPKSEPKQGLVSPFPYEINLTDDDNNKKGRFPSQENVFNKFLKPENKSDQVTPVAVKVDAGTPTQQEIKESEHTKLFTKYLKSVESLIGNKKINLGIRSNGFAFQSSQRLFIFDSVFDYLLDKLFGNKDLLNYYVKENKLLTSNLFGSNGLLKEKGQQEEENLPWNAPITAELKIAELLEKNKNSLAIAQVSAEPAQPTTTENKCWKCESFTNAGTNKESWRSLLNSLLRIYFFRSYLTKVKEKYFGFLGDFPNTKKSTSQQGDTIQTQQGTTTRFTFLTSDLFNHWRRSHLQDVKERDNFLNFLITLNFLSKNNFAKLKEALKSELVSTTKFHYLFFEAVKHKTSEKQDEGNKKVIHPFLSSDAKKEPNNNNFFNNKNDAWNFLRESWRIHSKLSLDKKTDQQSSGAPSSPSQAPSKEEKEAIFKETFTEHSALPSQNLNLFNFKNLRGLLEAIKRMTSYSEFEKLVTLISKISNSIKSEFYKVDRVYMHNHQAKNIFLEEKKKLLIYQLLNTNKGPFYSSTNFSNEDDKNIFKKSLDELISDFEKSQKPEAQTTSAPQTKPAQQNNSRHHLEEKHFKRLKGVMNDGSGYYIQVSARDFDDDTSICDFFNLLPIDLLADFMMIQTDKPLNKENAQNDFFEKTHRLKPRDMKFKNHVDSKHVE